MVIEITEFNFKQEVEESNLPIIIDFYATWCGPCRIVKPIFTELSDEYTGKVKFVLVNIDQQRDLAIQFGISSIPAFVLMQGGEILAKTVGGRSYDDLRAFIDHHLK